MYSCEKTLAIVLALVLLLLITACSENETNTIADSQTIPADAIVQSDVVVYEDNSLKVTFKGVSDIAGQIGMTFSLENKSNEEIMVFPMNSSVNDVMVQFVSGIPASIQPGKTFNQVWMANPEVVGVSNSSEVTVIEFVLTFEDTETEVIKITP